MTDASLPIALKALNGMYALGTKAVPIAISQPMISVGGGLPVVGTVVVGVHGTYTSKANTYSYRWLRDGAAISGAAAQTYALQSADVGRSITFEETPTNAIGAGGANVSASVFCLDVLGPTTASFAPGALVGTNIFTVTGLASGETITNFAPNDGRISVSSGGVGTVGDTVTSPGTINCSLTTSLGRTLAVIVTASNAKRAQFLWGGSGLGAANPTSLVSVNDRRAMALAVNTDEWRFRIANADAGATIAGNANFSGVWIGAAVLDGNGEPTGAFASAPVQVSGAFTTNADGTVFISDWVTAPAAQWKANTVMLVSFGWTPVGTSVGRGNGKYWYIIGAGAAANAGLASPGTFSTSGSMWWDISVEYKFSGNNAVWLVVGDSNSEALTGPTIPLFRTWAHKAALDVGAVAIVSARGGQSTDTFINANVNDWRRLSADLTPDTLVIDLSINDVSASKSLANYKVNKDAISAVAKARYPGISRDYRVTIPPRAYLPAQDANETLRLSYNTDALIPSVGIAGTLNFDLALRDPANQRQLLPAYAGNSGDGIHGNTAFHSAKAGVATAMLPATAP